MPTILSIFEEKASALEKEPDYIAMRNWKEAVFNETVELATVNKLTGMPLETTINTDRFNTIIDWNRRIKDPNTFPTNEKWWIVLKKMKKHEKKYQKV